MGAALTALVFLSCSLSGELKVIIIVAASDDDTITEITGEDVKLVASALMEVAPEGVLKGFHYVDKTLTAFINIPLDPKIEVLRVTHESDSATTSVFLTNKIVSGVILQRKIRTVAKAWSHTRHPKLANSHLPEVKIKGMRVEVLFVEPEVVTRGK
jgi:hypothetical protein